LTSFPLQLPGYAYCVVEHTAPADYVAATGTTCTPVLTGSVSPTPPVVTLITVADPFATVVLPAHKFNSEAPGTSIPGAVYDLYVHGSGPPGPAPAAPPSAPVEPGDEWWAQGTTDASGNVSFTIPAGYSWCLAENPTGVPLDYQLDTALHCTAFLDAATADPPATVALPEVLASVMLTAHKYNSLVAGTSIPGAVYDLYVEGPPPPGYDPTAEPSPTPTVEPGDEWWARETTSPAGNLAVSVPAGYAWCFREVAAPPGYQLDQAMHCTAVITTAASSGTGPVALPEQPTPVPTPPPPPGHLAYTGGPGPALPAGGLVAAAAGLLLVVLGRRRARRLATTAPRHRRRRIDQSPTGDPF
jgi:hypothetical protein